jgi:hypothetical protein
MKQAALSRNKMKAKVGNRQNPEVNAEAVTILRTVKDQEAFYFYEDVGKPTGEVARNLSDFLDKVRSAKSESLVFHVKRNDFRSWFQKILGDKKLAQKLERMPPSNSNEIRTCICRAVENRIKELKETSTIILVSDNSALLPARI